MSELSGLKVMVVEDEALIAMALSRLLTMLGCQVVGPALNLDQGMRLFETETFDGAILDVNLGQEKVFPLADALAEQSVPFIFVTGYGKECLRQCIHFRPVLQKPYKPKELVDMLSQWRHS